MLMRMVTLSAIPLLLLFSMQVWAQRSTKCNDSDFRRFHEQGKIAFEKLMYESCADAFTCAFQLKPKNLRGNGYGRGSYEVCSKQAEGKMILCDLFGNVSEWTASTYDTSHTECMVLKGGRFCSDAAVLTINAESIEHDTNPHHLNRLGFRCVRDAPKNPKDEGDNGTI